MKILCKHNSSSGLSDARKILISKFIRTANSRTHLRVGENYFAFGAIFRDNFPWLYVFVDDSDQYPKPYPVDYFDLNDWQVPPQWVVRSRMLNNGSASTEIVPRLWASNSNFYERLVDGDPEAQSIMRQIRSEA